MEASSSPPPGPTLVRMYLCPTIPSAERLRCETCGQVALPGRSVVHSKGCDWLARQEEPLGGGEGGVRTEPA